MANTKTINKPSDGLSLGQSVMVKPAPGVRLVNNETGGYFEADVQTPQTVTSTLIRRLDDGDLVLALPAA